MSSLFDSLPGLPKNLLDIDCIYHEPDVEQFERGREIFARFPDAERIEVPSHWNIPGLHGNEGSASQWLQIKRGVLVLGTRKAMKMELNGRSSDFIAPSSANGCASACAYCYVPRRKGFANPITTFVNIEQINRYIANHAEKQGMKFDATPADDDLWVYEIGCNSDTSIDAAISDNVRDMVALFTTIPNAKATFATKWVNRALLDYDPQRKTRIRFSLMPHAMSRLVDVRTSPISQRIAAMNDFYDAGYEVDVNFSPVIIEDDFLDRYDELFDEINNVVRSDVREKLVAEIIFLTHNKSMHVLNLQWHPKAESALWNPAMQENKISQSGGSNVRYRASLKTPLIQQFCERLNAKLPHCKIRYAF